MQGCCGLCWTGPLFNGRSFPGNCPLDLLAAKLADPDFRLDSSWDCPNYQPGISARPAARKDSTRRITGESS
jgi:hypothetical protein